MYKNQLTDAREVLLKLICEQAYCEGNFQLSSGQTSDYYINAKQATLRALGAKAVGEIILSLLPDSIQAVGGLTLGADPIVTAVSVVSAYQGRDIAALIVRKESKGHGTNAYIEGPSLPPGVKVVVLEDVVTTGKSAMKAVTRLREAGYSVKKIIAIVDRLQGGSEYYQSQELEFQALFSITEIQQRFRITNH